MRKKRARAWDRPRERWTERKRERWTKGETDRERDGQRREIDRGTMKRDGQRERRKEDRPMCILCTPCCLCTLEQRFWMTTLYFEGRWQTTLLICFMNDRHRLGITMQEWNAVQVNSFRSAFVEYCKWYTPLLKQHAIDKWNVLPSICPK